MKNDHTKVTELSKNQQEVMHLSGEMLMQKGMMQARLGMNAANHIANIEFMQAIKKHDLFHYAFSGAKADFIENWEEACQVYMSLPADEVDHQIAQLPALITEFKQNYKGCIGSTTLFNGYQEQLKEFIKKCAAAKNTKHNLLINK
jgi:hypothetical protein